MFVEASPTKHLQKGNSQHLWQELPWGLWGCSPNLCHDFLLPRLQKWNVSKFSHFQTEVLIKCNLDIMVLNYDYTAFAWQDCRDQEIQPYKVTSQCDRCHLGDKLEQPRMVLLNLIENKPFLSGVLGVLCHKWKSWGSAYIRQVSHSSLSFIELWGINFIAVLTATELNS